MYSKSSITAKDTQRYWHEIRLERRNEIRRILDQCQRLRNEHKLIFDKREVRPMKETVLHRFNPPERIEEELPMVNDVIDYSEESPSIVNENPNPNKSQLVTPRVKTYQRCPSIASVTSHEKRANRVYEPWPDYREISRIVGHRIEKPQIIPPSPVIEPSPSKRKKSLRFVDAVLQVQTLTLIEKKPIESPPPPPRKTSPKLPALLCPSSPSYSKRIQTRQWLLKNDFTSHRLALT